jgi:hypothetical protein
MCLPARETMRFRSMALATARNAVSVVTSLNHDYIDFAVQHTMQASGNGLVMQCRSRTTVHVRAHSTDLNGVVCPITQGSDA